MDNRISHSENSTSVLVCLDKDKLLQHLQERIQAAAFALARADDKGDILALKECFARLVICRDLHERIDKGEFDFFEQLPSPTHRATA